MCDPESSSPNKSLFQPTTVKAPVSLDLADSRFPCHQSNQQLRGPTVTGSTGGPTYTLMLKSHLQPLTL